MEKSIKERVIHLQLGDNHCKLHLNNFYIYEYRTLRKIIRELFLKTLQTEFDKDKYIYQLEYNLLDCIKELQNTPSNSEENHNKKEKIIFEAEEVIKKWRRS